MNPPDNLLAETAVVSLSGRIAARVIDGKAILVVVDTQKLHALNATGTFLFQAMGERTVGELADALVHEFDVGREQALHDTRTFLTELIELRAAEVRRP